jgi:hypothetical protein
MPTKGPMHKLLVASLTILVVGTAGIAFGGCGSSDDDERSADIGAAAVQDSPPPPPGGGAAPPPPPAQPPVKPPTTTAPTPPPAPPPEVNPFASCQKKKGKARKKCLKKVRASL